MAATVSPDLTLVSDADTTTGWSGNSGGLDDEVKIQGNGSYTWQAAKNSRTECTFTPATNLDMSATDTHVYFWFKCDVFPFSEDKKTGTGSPSGLTFRLTDGSSNYKEWHIAGKDTWGGEWKCFVVDIANTDQLYVSSGTLQTNDIDVLTWYVDISNSGIIRIIDNCWNDVVRYGTGLTITGTDFDLIDVAADDANSSNRYGILENIDGVVFCQGRLNIGSGATTTTFNSTDEALIFRNRIGDGKGGMVSSTLYELNFAGSGCTSDITGLVCKGAGATDTTRPKVDASDTNTDVTMDGCTFIHCGTVDFASTGDIQNTKFSDCKQVDPSTGVFQGNSLVNYTGSDGALLFPSNDANCTDLKFINCDNGVEYDSNSDSTDPKFDNFVFDDVSGKYDVNNTKGSAVTISLINTPSGKANSYNPGGSAVTFTSDPVITLITVKDIETLSVVTSARVRLEASDNTGPLNFEESVSIVRTDTTATVTHTDHGLVTDDYVRIKGADQWQYNGVKQITYVNDDTYTFSVSGSPATPATGTITSTTVVISDLTDGSGQVSDSRVLSSNQPVIGTARKASSGTLYKPQPITGTISASSGLTMTVLLIPDE